MVNAQLTRDLMHLDSTVEGPRSGMRRTTKLILAVTLHNIPEGMAVFVSVPDTMLDVLLSAMREKGIKIPLKAVLTPYNAVWDANTLYRELARERKEMTGK